jgi:hypothetical protein
VISFSRLGNYGRLGNQLFQYAFLRITARRLGVPFYCPSWDGDEIFDLADGAERALSPDGIDREFDADPEAGFTARALAIGDHTEIRGNFQSENYFPSRELVLSWYAFKPSLKDSVERKYSPGSLAETVSLSLRIDGDYASTREFFPLYPPSFYERGLRALDARGRVLVFADRPDLAREFFRPLHRHDLQFVTDLNGPEQLYLMSLCRANVITNSTFSWWGGWLNNRADRTIVAPSSWCRPGIPIDIADILCDDWLKIRGTTPIWDHFQVWRLRHPLATLRRAWARRSPPASAHSASRPQV